MLKVSRLKRGKLKFKVKAKKIGSGQPRVTLTTQVSQGRNKSLSHSTGLANREGAPIGVIPRKAAERS